MSVRKAHNSGRNHLRNVIDYYQRAIYPLCPLPVSQSVMLTPKFFPQRSATRKPNQSSTPSPPPTPPRARPTTTPCCPRTSPAAVASVRPPACPSRRPSRGVSRRQASRPCQVLQQPPPPPPLHRAPRHRLATSPSRRPGAPAQTRPSRRSLRLPVVARPTCRPCPSPRRAALVVCRSHRPGACRSLPPVLEEPAPRRISRSRLLVGSLPGCRLSTPLVVLLWGRLEERRVRGGDDGGCLVEDPSSGGAATSASRVWGTDAAVYVEALFSCAVGRLRHMLKMHGYGEWRFGVGEHGRDKQASKREIWRLLARSRRKGPEVIDPMAAVKSACITGNSRRTSQPDTVQAAASKQSMAKDDRIGMEISLPLLVLHSWWSDLMLSCSVFEKSVHQRKYHFSR